MMQLLWHSQTDRHGSEDYADVTVEGAQAAVPLLQPAAFSAACRRSAFCSKVLTLAYPMLANRSPVALKVHFYLFESNGSETY